MLDESPQTMNPWLSIWTRPRQTIRWIVNTDPHRSVLLLAALAGIAQALDRASSRNLGDRISLPTILGLAVLLGPIGGIIGLYLGGFLLRWTGRWIGGRASPPEIRAAIAWSSVPAIVALPLWVPELALFGQELFTSETPTIDENPPLAAALLGFSVVEFCLAVWSFILLLKCVGEVQGFSAWKALGNVLLAALVIVLPILMAAFLIVMAMR